MKEKRCSKCKEIKSLDDFGLDRRTKDGHLCYCKSCKRLLNASQAEYRKEYMKKYLVTYHKSPDIRERERNYSRNYRSTHPEKNKAYSRKYRDALRETSDSATISKAKIDACLKYFNFECAYSGVPLSATYQIDHIVSVSNGGTNSLHNLAPCLPQINAFKGAHDLESWYPMQSFYSESRYNKIKEWMKKEEG